MLTSDFNDATELQKIKTLIQHLRKYIEDIGAYIEHFSYEESKIIIKLSNGFLPVEQSVFRVQDINQLGPDRLKEISKLFVKTVLN